MRTNSSAICRLCIKCSIIYIINQIFLSNFIGGKKMVTNYAQLQELIKKNGKDFPLEKALELAKAGGLDD